MLVLFFVVSSVVFNVLRFSEQVFHSDCIRQKKECRRREIFGPGENKSHHRKARVYETIISRSLISRSFDSGPCEACLVSMRDNVLLLHSWDGRPYFILFTNMTLHRLVSVMLTVGFCLRQNKDKRKRESKWYRC